MQKLLSIPDNLVHSFNEITGNNSDDWFVNCDPAGCKVGSGGGTAFLLEAHRIRSKRLTSFKDYLSESKKIVIHAGGESRRLPAYAPSGKSLLPIPIFRWSHGQRVDQTLIDLQIPILERIMEVSCDNQHLMIASGDVLLQSVEIPFSLPNADIICFGIWADPHFASRHGVFFTSRNKPECLEFILQKPDLSTIEMNSDSYLYLMDTGIWILSDKAVAMLMRKCGWNGSNFENEIPCFYDLYKDFGTCLGQHPSESDNEIGSLSVEILPLNKAEFYHFGTTLEMITSTERIQNKIQDQRNIIHNRVKPHPSLFVQNALADIDWNVNNHHIWIENSHVPESWTLNHHNVITGIPGNDWYFELEEGICLDSIPIGESEYCIRPYGIYDIFSGNVQMMNTKWMGKPLKQWFDERNINLAEAGIINDTDIQFAPLFPVITISGSTEGLINWMFHGDDQLNMKKLWLSCKRLSASQINSEANLIRLFNQREKFRQQNLKKLSFNYKRSIFYQADLKYIAGEFVKGNIESPEVLPQAEPALLRMRDHMFRSEMLKIKGLDGKEEETKAFNVLQTVITSSSQRKFLPKLNVFSDQIVWGRSPARLDLAGGWSDTPPYCLLHGGSVLNMAVELNSQPPIQAYIRLSEEKIITLRSIDNGVSEILKTFDDISAFNAVGSAFSIPKAALYLAGFHPDFCSVKYNSLKEQLDDFGGGIEISLLVAIPKGSGLGTSSILAATLLGSLSDFCSLNLDLQTICHTVLILEQLLTTGGGWQDQYGGIYPGVKILESEPGIQDKVGIRWLPDRLFTNIEFKDNWLLYYTGITRIAKNILSEIVRAMFLNEGKRLRIVDEIKNHTYNLVEAIQQSDFSHTANLIGKSWKLNVNLDAGTNTPEIQYIINMINDFALGYKLLGAGGGGYMLIAAKNIDAASKIQSILNQNPSNKKARFVKMEISQTGFQISRS